MICRFVFFWVKGQNHRTCFTINATVSMENKNKKTTRRKQTLGRVLVLDPVKVAVCVKEGLLGVKLCVCLSFSKDGVAIRFMMMHDHSG